MLLITSLSTLESHQWEATSTQRGSPMDHAYRKSYIQPLMFLKRICDVWDEECQETIQTHGEDFAHGNRKALIVMATGTGKTRTTAGLMGVFIQDLKRVVYHGSS